MSEKLKTGNSVFTAFFIVGIVLIIASVSLLTTGIFFAVNTPSTDAVITKIDAYSDSDGDDYHEVFVSYEVDGVQYDNVSLNYYFSNMHRGKTIKIHYEEGNPEHIIYITFYFIISPPLLVFALVFGLVGGVPIIKSAKRKKLLKKLKTSSVPKKAYITNLYLDYSYTVNGHYVNAYFACEYYDDMIDKNQKFISYSFRISPYVRLGCTVDVYFPNANIKTDYIIDMDSVKAGNVSDIPEEVKTHSDNFGFSALQDDKNGKIENLEQGDASTTNDEYEQFLIDNKKDFDDFNSDF